MLKVLGGSRECYGFHVKKDNEINNFGKHNLSIESTCKVRIFSIDKRSAFAHFLLYLRERMMGKFLAVFLALAVLGATSGAAEEATNRLCECNDIQGPRLRESQREQEAILRHLGTVLLPGLVSVALWVKISKSIKLN